MACLIININSSLILCKITLCNFVQFVSYPYIFFIFLDVYWRKNNRNVDTMRGRFSILPDGTLQVTIFIFLMFTNTISYLLFQTYHLNIKKDTIPGQKVDNKLYKTENHNPLIPKHLFVSFFLHQYIDQGNCTKSYNSCHRPLQ